MKQTEITELLELAFNTRSVKKQNGRSKQKTNSAMGNLNPTISTFNVNKLKD